MATAGAKRRRSKTTGLATQTPNLAANLRGLRLSKQLTLKEVANATGISTSLLSLVENRKSDITIGRLVRLVNLYGVSLIDLIPPPPDDPEPDVMRVTERRLVSTSSPAERINIYFLTPDMKRALLPMELEFDPGAELAEYGCHEGEEWVYVLEGRLRLLLDGAEPHLLNEGDSAYYPGDRPHLFQNDDPEKRLRLVCVNSAKNDR
jgi:quercetin dioxygenase-like cupin family protein